MYGSLAKLRRGMGTRLLLSAFLLCGCGGGRGTVSGKVAFDGKPVPTGMISFHSKVGNKEVNNAAILNGSYSISNIPAGETDVTIKSVDPAKAASGSGAKASKEGGADARSAPKEGTSNYVPIPQRYSVPDQAGLTLTVTKGEQTFNVDLKP